MSGRAMKLKYQNSRTVGQLYVNRGTIDFCTRPTLGPRIDHKIDLNRHSKLIYLIQLIPDSYMTLIVGWYCAFRVRFFILYSNIWVCEMFPTYCSAIYRFQEIIIIIIIIILL